VTTRRQIATAAVELLWEAHEAEVAYAYMDAQSLADEIPEASSPETVSNALSAFGDEVCKELHPGFRLTRNDVDGHRIVDRLNERDIKQATGKVRCEVTKNRRAAAAFSARRNPTTLKEASRELDRYRAMVLEPLERRLDQFITAQDQRAARRVGRRG
jgi:hypothetical protein